MADDKKLRISAKIDEKGLKAFDASLKSIDKKLTALGKKLTVLNENFKKLSKSLRMDVGKGFEKADKNIEANTKAMDKAVNTTQKLTKSYQNLQKAISGGVGDALSGAQIAPVPGGGFTIIPGGGGGGAGGGGAGGAGGTGRPRRRPQTNAMQRFMNGLYIAANQTAGISNFIQNQKTQDVVNAANIRSVGAGMYGAAAGGSIDDLFVFNRASRNGTSLNNMAGGIKAPVGTMLGNSAGMVAQGYQTGSVPGAILGAAGGVANMAAGNVNGTPQSIEADSYKRIIQGAKGISAVDLIKIHQLQQVAPGLLNANRRLAGGGMKAAWMGVGAGLDANTSFNLFTQGANHFGANVMMGETVNRRITKNVPGLTVNGIQLPGHATSVMGKATVGSLGANAIALQRKGFDANTMTNAMGNIQGLLSGTNTERVNQANTMVVDAISRGVALGIKDPQTLEALSNSIASANSTVNGAMTDSGALAGALAAGLNGKTANPALINQRMQGLGVLSQGINSNPVLRNRAYAAATSILGNDSPMVARTALVQAGLSELMGGSARLTALLPGDENRQLEARRREVSAKLQDMVSLAGNDLPAVREALAKNGNNGLALLSDPKMRMAIAADLRTAHGFTDTILSDRGFGAGLNFVNGKMSNGDKKFFDSLKDHGGAALTAEQSRARALLEPLGELFKNKTLMKEATQAFEGLGKFMGTIGGLNTSDWTNAEEVMAAIEHLANTLNGVDPKKVDAVTKTVEKAAAKVGKEDRHRAVAPGAKKG